MKFIMILFALIAQEKQSYSYMSYFDSGEAYKIVYDLERQKVIAGSTIVDMTIEDCSTDSFKCLLLGNEYFFIPKEMKMSGEYKSPFGKYIIYDNEGILPFGTDIDYTAVQLFTLDGSKHNVTIFYNQFKGVIAIIESDKRHKITWLLGDCGILSSEICRNDKRQ